MVVRLYGHEVGEGSFRVVTEGLALALQSYGQLAGRFPIDLELAEDEFRPGALAPVALHAGAPTAVALSIAHGRHPHCWLMLAPNSDRIPERMLEWIPRRLTALCTPSTWGAEVLRQQLGTVGSEIPVFVVPHGVVPVASHLPAELPPPPGPTRLRVLHLTSTNGQRKGTRELIRAMKSPELSDVLLRLIVDPMGYLEVLSWVEDAGIKDRTLVQHSLQIEAEHMPLLYRSADLVCQPSRAEGFGLAPLEALCAGVPVVATACTGHSEYLGEASQRRQESVVVIKHGEICPIDDLPNALAPEVTTESVVEALCDAKARIEELKDGARRHAASWVTDWRWEASSGPPLMAMLNTLGVE